jgi:hypothetical protein
MAWESLGLKDYSEYCDAVQYFNQADDYCDSCRGEWFWDDPDTLTVYGGTFGNDHSPGSDHYTWAEVFDDASEFEQRVKFLESLPEWLESDDDESEDE